jgi:hypothetical protein
MGWRLIVETVTSGGYWAGLILLLVPGPWNTFRLSNVEPMFPRNAKAPRSLNRGGGAASL